MFFKVVDIGFVMWNDELLWTSILLVSFKNGNLNNQSSVLWKLTAWNYNSFLAETVGYAFMLSTIL